MVKKIPNVSKWGQDTARERYQFGGAPFVPPQAMTRPGMPLGRRFQEGGGVKKDEVKPLGIKPPGMPQSEMNKILSGAQKDWVEGKYK